MVRIGVNIPNELMKRIGPAIDRLLKQEKEFLAAISFDWQALAWEDAASWVNGASDDNWNDFLDELEWLDDNNKPHWEIMPLHIDGVKHLHDREMELHNRMEQARQRNPGFDRWLHRRPWRHRLPGH